MRPGRQCPGREACGRRVLQARAPVLAAKRDSRSRRGRRTSCSRTRRPSSLRRPPSRPCSPSRAGAEARPPPRRPPCPRCCRRPPRPAAAAAAASSGTATPERSAGGAARRSCSTGSRRRSTCWCRRSRSCSTSTTSPRRTRGCTGCSTRKATSTASSPTWGGQGACAERDGDDAYSERIVVKDSNDYSEMFDVLSSTGYIRRGRRRLPRRPAPRLRSRSTGGRRHAARRAAVAAGPIRRRSTRFNCKVHLPGIEYYTLDSTPIVGPERRLLRVGRLHRRPVAVPGPARGRAGPRRVRELARRAGAGHRPPRPDLDAERRQLLHRRGQRLRRTPRTTSTSWVYVPGGVHGPRRTAPVHGRSARAQTARLHVARPTVERP